MQEAAVHPCSHIRTCYAQTSVALLYRDLPNPASLHAGKSRREAGAWRSAKVWHLHSTEGRDSSFPAGEDGCPRLPGVPVPSSPAARRVAASITALQSLALAGFAAFYLYELVIGEGSDTGRVVMSALLILGAAIALAVLARGWLGAGEWPRTPTIVWNLLLLPVGWSMLQAGRTGLGWTVLLAAAVATLVALSSRPESSSDGAGSDT